MRKAERVVLYTVMSAALAACGWSALNAGGAGRAYALPTRLEPATARVATCDMFDLVDRVLRSDRYEPARKVEEERIRATLEPMQQEMNALRAELTGADMQTDANKAKATVYQEKAQAAMAAEKKAQTDFTAFLTGQFNEAYELARRTAGSVAERLGYTYVLASRGPEKKIEATDPQALVQEFLSRTVVTAPSGTDITGEVARELNLPELPKADPAAPGDQAPAPGAQTSPADAPKPAEAPSPAVDPAAPK